VRDANKEFHNTEELVSLVALKRKTNGADIQRAVELVINDIGLKYEQLCGLNTQGKPSIVGQIHSVIALMEKTQSNAGTINTIIKTMYHPP